MAQEFTINSSAIESKINQLLPSQGGFGAGVDFSASTMVIPIVDLTESAEGGTARADLQTASSLTSSTAFNVSNASTTIINTTGYFRIFGSLSIRPNPGVAEEATFNLTDGTTTKKIYGIDVPPSSNISVNTFNYDFVVFLAAGDSCIAVSASTASQLIGSTRQIADISGNLVNPL